MIYSNTGNGVVVSSASLSASVVKSSNKVGNCESKFSITEFKRESIILSILFSSIFMSSEATDEVTGEAVEVVVVVEGFVFSISLI